MLPPRSSGDVTETTTGNDFFHPSRSFFVGKYSALGGKPSLHSPPSLLPLPIERSKR